MRCEESMTILEILRLTEQGLGQRAIANGAQCAKSTVGEIQKRCREVGLTYEKAALLAGGELQRLVYPKGSKRFLKPDPDYEYIHTELLKHPKLNLRFMWEEYKEQCPDGLEYSQFCERYNGWKDGTGKNVTMHQEREAGKEMFVDWMGDTLPCVVDSDTGEVHTAHFFVSALGNSGFPYVEAFPDEKLDKWLTGHTHAFASYTGLPRIVVPDNCKTAVTKPQHYDPSINPAYWELARHYNIAVLPARIREPRDKALIEESVGWLETWLLGWLRNQQFFSFEELNRTVRERINELVRKPYQKRPGSRLSVFNDIDLPALRPLGPRFETADMKYRMVPDNYHVEYEGFYYSVLYKYYRQKVMVRATSSIIEIYDSDRLRITSHVRRYSGKRYITDPNHMPEHHRKYWDSKQFSGDRYRAWAKNIGENTHYVITAMLAANGIEEQAYKACMGVLQFSQKYGEERLENACTRARSIKSCTYTTIMNILKNGQDLIKPSVNQTKALPAHENVRGQSYYV